VCVCVVYEIAVDFHNNFVIMLIFRHLTLR